MVGECSGSPGLTKDKHNSDNATILTEIQECVNNPAVIQAAELARTQINAVDTSAVEL